MRDRANAQGCERTPRCARARRAGLALLAATLAVAACDEEGLVVRDAARDTATDARDGAGGSTGGTGGSTAGTGGSTAGTGGSTAGSGGTGGSTGGTSGTGGTGGVDAPADVPAPDAPVVDTAVPDAPVADTPVTDGGSDGSAAACGAAGQPCCRGKVCNSGGCCISRPSGGGVCEASGQACGYGFAGSCMNGSCGPAGSACGGLGQPCCMARGDGHCTGNGTTCMGTTCAACGGQGQPCCRFSTRDADSCQAGFACDDNAGASRCQVPTDAGADASPDSADAGDAGG
jgi:hypothetical protein